MAINGLTRANALRLEAKNTFRKKPLEPKPNDDTTYVCGAIRKDGSICVKDRKLDPHNGRCSIHGGLHDRPSSFRDPRATIARKTTPIQRVIPRRLIEAFDASLTNQSKLQLDEKIALLDARLVELVTRLNAAPTWPEVVEKIGDALQHLRERRFAVAREQLEHLLESQPNQILADAPWGEIRDLIEQHRKTTETEGKRRVADRELVSYEEVVGILVEMFGKALNYIPENSDRLEFTRDARLIMQRRRDGLKSIMQYGTPEEAVALGDEVMAA